MSDPSVPTQHSSTGPVPAAPAEASSAPGPSFLGNAPAADVAPPGSAKRRRGSRGGRNRRKPGTGGESVGDLASPESRADSANDARERVSGRSVADTDTPADTDVSSRTPTTSPNQPRARRRAPANTETAAVIGELDRRPDDMPDPPWEAKPDVVEVPPPSSLRPRIGDSRPAPFPEPTTSSASVPAANTGATNPAATSSARSRPSRRSRDRTGRPRPDAAAAAEAPITTANVEQARRSKGPSADAAEASPVNDDVNDQRRRRRGKNATTAVMMEPRRGRERKGRPVGRYLMCVHVTESATQIAVLEGRSLIEHYVSRPTDNTTQIHGNIYMGRVQNVLPGMEAAFVDISTPKNAVIYRGDLQFDTADVETTSGRSDARIEQVLRNGQLVLCQVTKNPIGSKGARLTQEVSMPGRFVVLIPNSDTYGISKRLPDDERKRLRRILDEVKPAHHGIIVRTAASGVSADELRRDVELLVATWTQIDAKAQRTKGPALLYSEPDLAVRVIREEFSGDYRGVIIDNWALYEEIHSYVESISPELADRVEFHDPAAEALPIFEQHHVHEQVHKAIDRKVWLPSGGSIIIERTEALTVIDVNTGKNVGSTSLEETVYRNNLEAAEEIARQLRLRDIGGIIVIDFIDMENRANRGSVVSSFREALARDKTRTQVFEISELGLVEMTRKRISEGLVESLSTVCPTCAGRGLVFDAELTS